MRTFLAVCAAIIGLALAGCASTSNTTLTEGKALDAAWTTFGTTASVLDNLEVAGQLSVQEKATIHAVEPQIQQALVDATSAYDSGNSASVEQNVATATALLTQLITIATTHGSK